MCHILDRPVYLSFQVVVSVTFFFLILSISSPMELGSIVQFLENKTILVTGATGFLAKIFVEKILRTQPNVGKIFLLLRAADNKSAKQRFHDQIISKELFRSVREKWGANLNSFILKKITLVPGDISCEDLGVKDSNLREEMWREIDFIVNMAATTNFDERYDIALGINTLGAKHVLNFAKKCAKLKALLHVSTAYVCGEREGLVLEEPLTMGKTLIGTSQLDINEEKELVEERLNELQAEGCTEELITSTMKDMGIQRSRMYGWPNTYVYTKAMGEMLLGHFKENLPLVIIRPTIITSTYKEPFPGWVEGVRTIDSVLIGYGKGKLKCLLGDPECIIDVIPADMVVNSMIVAMVAHASQPCEMIYQVGSSLRNPLKLFDLHDIFFLYFSHNPWMDKYGNTIRVGKGLVLSTIAGFHRYMAIFYLLPLKGLQLVNMVFGQYFKDMQMDLNQRITLVKRFVELYKPYLFFKAVFDDMQLEKLRRAARESSVEGDMFDFDPKYIDWEEYFMKTHVPGFIKYVMK